MLRGKGAGKYTDRVSAMRHMRFQGNLRMPRKKKKNASASLSTGWNQKESVVFDEKLGLKRNEVLGGGNTNFFEDSNAPCAYIDSNRMVDHHEDIKTVMSQAKKLPQKRFGNQTSSTTKDRWADDTDFQESGGIHGYIARAKSLMGKQKLYSQAINYLSVAISHGLQDFYITQTENEDVLLARQLRASCQLKAANYYEAEAEAARILFWDSTNGQALYIQAEALYLQCKFERALMVYHRGCRLRTDLYGETFRRGIIKATTAILHSIKSLDTPNNATSNSGNPKDIIPPQVSPELIEKSFKEDGYPTGRNQKKAQASGKVDEVVHPVLFIREKPPSPFGATFLKKQWHSKNKDKSAKNNGVLQKKGPSLKTRGLQERNKHDRNLRRLRTDEKFLDTLCVVFKTTGPDSATENNNTLVASLMKSADGNKGGGYSKGSEEHEWDLSIPPTRPGMYDRKIAKMASEVLDFIEGRKHFWALQAEAKS